MGTLLVLRVLNIRTELTVGDEFVVEVAVVTVGASVGTSVYW